MCQCDTYDPCLGHYLWKKHYSYETQGQTDKGDVSIFIICLYFIFHTGKSGSLHVSANEGSWKSLSLNKILFRR